MIYFQKNKNKTTVAPPSIMSLVLTSECNLRCKHCHMWMNNDNVHVLKLEDRKRAIDEFYNINPYGTIVLCGGELMLKEDEFFTLTEHCKKLGIKSLAISNSSLINESNYEKLITKGPNTLTISLDGHLESIHDYMRGVKGAFNHVIDVINNLVSLRKNKYPKSEFKIMTNTTLFEKNIYLFYDVIGFIKSLGIDNANFEILHETYQKNIALGDKDPFFQKNFFQNETTAIKMLDEIINYSRNDSFITNSTENFERMKVEIHNTFSGLNKPSCFGLSEKDLIIEFDGTYKLSPNMDLYKEVGNIGNIKNIPIKLFWNSDKANMAREILFKKDNY